MRKSVRCVLSQPDKSNTETLTLWEASDFIYAQKQITRIKNPHYITIDLYLSIKLNPNAPNNMPKYNYPYA